MTQPLTRDELIDVLETVLKSQLRSLRLVRRARTGRQTGERTGGRKSNMSLVRDLLKAAGQPLHINEIILRAKQQHGVVLKRESIVSALTKKVLDGDTFRRTGRNVFALIESEV